MINGMERFGIRVGRRWRWEEPSGQGAGLSAPTGRGRGADSVRDSFELRLNGRDLTGDAPEDRPLALLVELTEGAAELLRGERPKLLLPFRDSTWELALAPRGADLALSCYSFGARFDATAHNEHLTRDELVRALSDAIDRVSADLVDPPRDLRSYRRRLHAARGELLRGGAQAPTSATAPGAPGPALEVLCEPAGDVTFVCRYSPATAELLEYDGRPRWDLHSLLFRGRLGWTSPGSETASCRAAETEQGCLFPTLAQLVLTLDAAMEADGHSRAVQLPAISDGTRSYSLACADGDLRLSEGEPGPDRHATVRLPLRAAASALLSLCRRVALRVLELNPRQAENSRIRDFLQDVGDTVRQMALATPPDTPPGPGPPPSGPARRLVTPHAQPSIVAGHVRRLRHELRWELPWQSTRPPSYLGLHGRGVVAACGERVCVADPSAGNLLLDRRDVDGRLSWALTHRYLALLDASGRLQLHDLAASALRPLWRRREAHGARLSQGGAAVPLVGATPLIILHLGGRGLLAVGVADGVPAWRVLEAGDGPAWLVAAGDMMLCCDRAGTLRAYRCATGALVWRQRVPARLGAPPLWVGHRILLAGGERRGVRAETLALELSTGAVLWRQPVGDGPPRGVVTDGEHAYASAPLRQGALLSCLDLATGAFRWQRALGGLGFDAPGQPLRFADHVICRSDHGRVACFAARDGALRWSKDTTCGDGGLQLLRTVDPVLAGGAVFVASDRVHSLDPDRGRTLGSLGAPGRTPEMLSVDEKLAVFVAHDEGVTAYGLRTALGVVPGPRP